MSSTAFPWRVIASDQKVRLITVVGDDVVASVDGRVINAVLGSSIDGSWHAFAKKQGIIENLRRPFAIVQGDGEARGLFVALRGVATTYPHALRVLFGVCYTFSRYYAWRDQHRIDRGDCRCPEDVRYAYWMRDNNLRLKCDLEHIGLTRDAHPVITPLPSGPRRIDVSQAAKLSRSGDHAGLLAICSAFRAEMRADEAENLEGFAALIRYFVPDPDRTMRVIHRMCVRDGATFSEVEDTLSAYICATLRAPKV